MHSPNCYLCEKDSPCTLGAGDDSHKNGRAVYGLGAKLQATASKLAHHHAELATYSWTAACISCQGSRLAFSMAQMPAGTTTALATSHNSSSSE